MTRRAIKEILKDVGLEEADRRLREQRSEIERLRHFETQVHDSRPERLSRALDENRAIWLEKHVPRSEAAIYVDDPIYGQLLIDEQIAPILRHPLVQRLAHVKQLSFSYLTFPGATHTRLSHSLGACKNAERALTRILQKGIFYTANGPAKINLTEDAKRNLVIKAKVAALLHDLGHGPFGHGLDQYVSAMIDEPSPDKFYAVSYVTEHLAETIVSCGINVDEILAILDSKRRTELDGFDKLISSLIDSPIDVDRMDYLVRDAHMTGLSIGAVNIEALIEHMVPFRGPIEVEGKNKEQIILAFESSAISHITHLLYARDSMYLNCYEHPGKVVAERMLTKAVQHFSERNAPITIDDLVLLSDEELLRMLIEFSDPGDISHHYANALLINLPFREVFSICPKKHDAYFEKRKAHIEAEGIEVSPIKEPQIIEGKEISREEEDVPQKPARRIENWENDTLGYKDRNLTTPGNWEEKIATVAGLGMDSWKVVVTVPSPGMFEPKFDDIKILAQTGSSYSYRKLDRMTGFWEGILKHLAVERYSIKVFAAADLSESKIEKIHQAAKELLTEE